MTITLNLSDDARIEVVRALESQIAYLGGYLCRVVYLDDGTTKVIPSEQSITQLKEVLAVFETSS